MIFSILANSVCLSIYDYSDPDNKLSRNKILGILDLVFTGIYTFEAMLKIISYGFVVHAKSYLRDPWNGLDFFSLVFSYINLLPGVPNFKAIRIFRVIKPLRSINSMPTMKKLFNTLLMSIPHIGQVVLFLIFVYGIFATIGNQLFKGDLYRRCRLTSKPLDEITGKMNRNWPADPNQSERLCGAYYTCN